MPLVIYYNKGQISHYILTLLWPVFYEATYLLVLFNKRRIITFRKLFVIIWGVGLFYFILSRLSDLTNQSNTIYYAFLELPLLLCVRKKKNQVLILILFSVLALLSMKRSCIFAVLGIWTLYSCVLIMKSNGKRKVTGIMIVLFLLLVGVFSFNQIDVMLGGQISERMNKEETDEGRGRLAIYEVTWLMQQHSSMNEWLLGHGHNGVWHNSPLEISAHNDFMEVLYDYGLIVFILYLCLWGYVMNKCLYLYRINSYFLVPYISSICIFIVLSLVSHLVLYTSYFNLLVIFWAGVEAFVEKEKRSVKFRY
ncbi:O-antigen ligase family protein [Bacteroides salyersiae]|uniref:O-antigen ligase family protein n=1 Tax=Bacteroides salyersiae TaxID=291644 RepID=UPI001CCE63FA|nr:O-antigen ligase family protein [Bacteroides salyersiae]